MNIHNFINIIKITNKFANFKNYLKLLSPEERLREINFMINGFNRSNRNGENIAKTFCILKKLKTLIKKQIIINHKEHSRYE